MGVFHGWHLLSIPVREMDGAVLADGWFPLFASCFSLPSFPRGLSFPSWHTLVARCTMIDCTPSVYYATHAYISLPPSPGLSREDVHRCPHRLSGLGADVGHIRAACALLGDPVAYGGTISSCKGYTTYSFLTSRRH